MNRTTIKFKEISDMLGRDETRKVIISEDIADLTLPDLINKLIKPLLAGIGYSDKLINKYLGED